MLSSAGKDVRITPLLKAIRICGCRDRIVTRRAPNRFVYTWHVTLPKCKSFIELEETYKWVARRNENQPPDQVLDGEPELTIGDKRVIIVSKELVTVNNFPEVTELIEFFLQNTEKLVSASNLLHAIESGIQALFRAEKERRSDYNARMRSQYGYGADNRTR